MKRRHSKPYCWAEGELARLRERNQEFNRRMKEREDDTRQSETVDAAINEHFETMDDAASNQTSDGESIVYTF